MVQHRVTSLRELREKPDDITVLTNRVTNAQLALVEQFEANMRLQSQLTNTQMALVEIFEMMNGGK